MKATFLFSLMFVAWAIASTIDENVAAGAAAERAQPREARPISDPFAPPRCPRFNAVGEPLLDSFAVQADGGEWSHECIYGVRA